MTYYLRLDQIDGESTVRGHAKWFELTGLAWGVHHSSGPGRGGGAGVGRAVLDPLQVTLAGSRSTPLLFQAVATGRNIATATLDVVASGEQPRSILKWDLQDVALTALQLSGEGGAPLVETLSLSYAKITLTSTGQDPKGAVSPGTVAGWDLTRNSAI